jgi:hypothetical protein
MRARTTFVWGLTPIILLVGVYLETKDRPKEPLRSVVTPPVTAPSAPTLSTGPITLKLKIADSEDLTVPTFGPDVWDYWEYKKVWEEQKEEMTALGFKRWQEGQAGVKLRVEAEVSQVGTTGYTNPDLCTLTVGVEARRGWTKHKSTIMECDQLIELRKGDPVVLNCVVDKHPGTYDPHTDDCELEKS